VVIVAMLSARPETYIVAIGGLDPGGGAGLVRDWLTAQALGASATLVGTAFTTQSPAGVRGFDPRPTAGIAAGLADALAQAAGRPTAVKIGMVGTAEVAATIAQALTGFAGPVVYDPVLGASSGGSLFRGMVSDLAPLWRRATLVTPNLDEAGALTARTVSSGQEAVAAAWALRDAGAGAVLVKGGHLAGAADDVLVSAAGERVFSAARVPGPSPRGTGCALATAIAIALAGGQPLEEAVAAAKAWLRERIAAARDLGGERRL
jgi:hydroxymethylpyrimidine/phosphomethylpyrimidine kinase